LDRILQLRLPKAVRLAINIAAYNPTTANQVRPEEETDGRWKA